MTKKHEELVEEIRLVWCKDCGDGPSRYEYSPDLDDDACEGGVETIKLCRERARECVTHTLSALRDGKIKILCPECPERIELLRCRACHLENLDGYIV